MGSEEELFSKAVPVKLKSQDREERQVVIGVTVILSTVSTPVHKKELVLRLTNEADPFFLFTLALGEEDFQGLKVQQGLLVDFGDFPQKLIGLLQLCLSETNNDNPKFLLQFCESGGQPASSLLHIVETNPFRHLNHLSLKLVSANDLCLKKYLAKCLLELKRENAALSERLSCTQSNFSTRLTECEEALRSRTQELEILKSDWSSRTAALSSEHSSGLNVERERSLRAQTEAQARFEQERRDLVQSHLDRLGSVEGRLQELDHSNKELTDHKFRSEATIRELEVKLRSSEEECSGMREELRRLRSDNSALYTGSHEQEKLLTQLRTRVAVLEQDLKAKEQVIDQNVQLLGAAREQKKVYESSLVQKERQITKLDTAFKTASQEVLKGNEIIQKLQAEMRNIKSKLKVRNMVTTKQESLLGERDKTIDSLRQEGESLKRSLSQKEEELRKSESAAEETRRNLDEAKEQLKTNENVISWLNKQVTDQKLGGGPGGGGLSSIRPSIPPYSMSNFTAGVLGSSYAALSGGVQQPQNMPQFSSTPSDDMIGTYTTSSAPSALPQYRASSLPIRRHRHVLGSLGSQENIGRQQQQQQQVLFKGGGKKLVPSPLAEHAHTAKGSPPTGGTLPTTGDRECVAPKRSPGELEEEPWLDPKYLPPEVPPSSNEVIGGQRNPYATITPGVTMKTTQGPNVGPGGLENRGRFQGHKGTMAGRLKPATLASSYFPTS